MFIMYIVLKVKGHAIVVTQHSKRNLPFARKPLQLNKLRVASHVKTEKVVNSESHRKG